jgi:hypothetical protein
VSQNPEPQKQPEGVARPSDSARDVQPTSGGGASAPSEHAQRNATEPQADVERPNYPSVRVDDEELRDFVNSSERTHANADNENPHLGFHRAGGGFIGYVPQVNGTAAEEVPLMPTRYEILVLVKHWETAALDYEFGEKFLLQQQCSSGRRIAAFARARIARMREVLGESVTDKAIQEAREAYSAGVSGRGAEGWQVYWQGTEEEQKAFHEESEGGAA